MPHNQDMEEIKRPSFNVLIDGRVIQRWINTRPEADKFAAQCRELDPSRNVTVEPA